MSNTKGKTSNGQGESGADIWFLLDRSGSMASIERDVVKGFDRFFKEQRKQGGEATVTIVQFDDQEPHDVLVDAKPLAKVRSIAERFEPRGMTPAVRRDRAAARPCRAARW